MECEIPTHYHFIYLFMLIIIIGYKLNGLVNPCTSIWKQHTNPSNEIHNTHELIHINVKEKKMWR